MRVATFNCENMKEEKRLQELGKVATGQRLDIIGLQEVKRVEAEDGKSLGKFKYLLHCNKCDAKGNNGGVGILVHKRFIDVKVTYPTERLCAAVITLKSKNKILFVSGHAPDTSASDADRKTFWEKLEATCKAVEADTKVIVAVDANTELGKHETSGDHPSTGAALPEGKANKNLGKLENVLTKCGLTSAATWHEKTDEERYTYKSSLDGRKEREYDHILVNEGKYVTRKLKLVWGRDDLKSDHALVIAQLDTRRTLNYGEKTPAPEDGLVIPQKYIGYVIGKKYATKKMIEYKFWVYMKMNPDTKGDTVVRFTGTNDKGKELAYSYVSRIVQKVGGETNRQSVTDEESAVIGG